MAITPKLIIELISENMRYIV